MSAAALPVLVGAAGCLSISGLDDDYALGAGAANGAGNVGGTAGTGATGGAPFGGQGGSGAAMTTTSTSSSTSSGTSGAGGTAGAGGTTGTGGSVGGGPVGGGGAGGNGGAGAAGGAGGIGGNPGDGGAGGGITWSCTDQYGTAAGYFACPSLAGECSFSVNTNGAMSCDDVCGSFGGECVHAWDNGAACEILQATTCDYAGYSTTMCDCSFGCGNGPPCQAPDVCSGGTCG